MPDDLPNETLAFQRNATHEDPHGVGVISIEIFVPLPPVALRANGRAHPMKKNKLADGYSKELYGIWLVDRFPTDGWKAATVTYTWCYSGVAPDEGNLGGNVKYLQDILCMAPRGSAGANRYYLGIVDDDKGITPIYKLKKVAHYTDEGVLVHLQRTA